MKDLHQALYSFWSGFGYDCYLTGHVPDNKDGATALTYPIITFNVEQPTRLGEAVLVAFDWHKARSGVNVNAERAALMDRIAEAIPEGGTAIDLGQGRWLWLTRNEAGFQSYYDDPDDKSVIGGRTSYIVHFFA